jgi:hypothetical protein
VNGREAGGRIPPPRDSPGVRPLRPGLTSPTRRARG